MIDAIQRWGVAFADPFVSPASRTFAPHLLVTAVVLFAVHRLHRSQGDWKHALGVHLWLHPSSQVDGQLLIARRVLALTGIVPAVGGAWWLAVRLSTTLDRVVGQPDIPAVSPVLLSIGYTLALFVVWDLSRFVTHLALHKVPLLWNFHQVHHSAEVLTPLTFHRTHPVESVLYGLRGVLTTGPMAGLAYWLFRGSAIEFTLLGVHGVGLMFTAISGNLRHSHAWIRFPASVERWFISPAQHQMHHALAEAHHDANFGTWLSVWDRGWGSFQLSPVEPVTLMGLDSPNHDPHSWLSALVSPFGSVVRSQRVVSALSVAFLLVIPAIALADDSSADVEWTEDPDDDEEADGSMIVTAKSGTLRVTGSAHVISEEELERHQYDDIHQVLATIPGVYLRGEDGHGLRPNIGLRGGNSDRSAKIALMEDGIPLAPAPYAAPAAYYFPMTMRMVGVEVIKGAAAIRHGPQTIGGAVNLLTRRIPLAEPVGELDIGYGSHNTVKAHGYSGYGADRWGVLAEYSRISTDGFKVLDDGGPTGFMRSDAMVKARVGTDRALSVFNELELKLGYGTEQSHETYLGLTESDFEATPDRRYNASSGDVMNWTRSGGSLIWRLIAGQDVDVRTTAYAHALDRAWTKFNGFSDGTSAHDLLVADPDEGLAESYLNVLRGDEDSTGVDQRILRGTNDRQFLNTGVASVGHWRWSNEWLDNELELGVRWHKDDVKRHHTETPWAMVGGSLASTESPEEILLDSHNDATAWAFHMNNDVGIGAVHFLPGVRHERITARTGTQDSGPTEEQTHSVWLPGVGGYIQLAPTLAVIGGVNKGFSPVPPGSAEGSVPETAWNYEAGLRYASALTTMEVFGFYSDYQNLTGQCTLSGGCTDEQLDTQFNGGEATVKGIETSMGQVVELGRGIALDADMAYAWTDAQFSSDFLSRFPQFGLVTAGDRLPYVPRHQGSGALALIHEQVTVSAQVSGRSGMHDAAASADDEMAIDSALSLDVGAEWRLGKRVGLYANGSNLTDRRSIESWRPYGARPTAPRSWMVGLKGRL